MIEFSYRNHAEYRLHAREHKNMTHAILNNDMYISIYVYIRNKEKTALSKLFGVK